MIGSLHPTQPHEVNILLESCLNFTATVDIGQIVINKNLRHHLGMIRRSASTAVFADKQLRVNLFDDIIYNLNRMGHGNKKRGYTTFETDPYLLGRSFLVTIR